MKPTAMVEKALAEASAARNRAYAPYSQFRVGASVLTAAGDCISGCNVENASYGATVCAERIAIWSAVASGERELTDVVIVTDASPPAYPCALCLQVMAEFLAPEAKIWLASLGGVQSVSAFSELLPQPFGPRQLATSKATAGER